MSFRRIVALSLLLVLFLLSGEALAWGPAVHVWIGDQVVRIAAAAGLPALAALLGRQARPFLYGNLAPDFEVGKGSRPHGDHNHNWCVGQRIVESAKTDSQRAFALGYMSHLAADVIGHNHFVPNNLYRSFGSKKLGHAYWEVHADNMVEGPYAALAAELVAAPTEETAEYDALVGAVARPGLLPFFAKKRIFTSFLAIANHSRARSLLDRVRPFSAMALRHEDVREQVELSLACAIEALRDPAIPLLGRYDPIGARNIKLAKELRRATRRAKGFSKGDIPFPIPAELRGLRQRIDAAVEVTA
jgi:hypothetical protein